MADERGMVCLALLLSIPIPYSQLPLCQRLDWGSEFILMIYGSIRWLCPLWPPLFLGDLSKLKPCWLDPKGSPQGQICNIMA